MDNVRLVLERKKTTFYRYIGVIPKPNHICSFDMNRIHESCECGVREYFSSNYKHAVIRAINVAGIVLYTQVLCVMYSVLLLLFSFVQYIGEVVWWIITYVQLIRSPWKEFSIIFSCSFGLKRERRFYWNYFGECRRVRTVE